MQGQIGCGVFVNLLKAFDTLDQQILLSKLNYYRICGISYLSNCNQILSKNGYDSGLAAISCGVPRGSVLRELPFLLYINDLRHFANDTNLLRLSNSIRKLKQLVNADLVY